MDLRSVNWRPAKKNSKKFRPLSSLPVPPSHASSRPTSTPKTFASAEHKVKAFADDLTASFPDHQKALSRIDTCCLDLDLHLRPDKYITLSFSGKRFDKKDHVSLHNGSTSNVSKQPAKFLGRYIDSSRSSSLLTSKSRVFNFKAALSKVDRRPIRGEYKMWIYRNYLAPSINFHLAVDAISRSSLHKMEALATKMLKRWLGLPRSATKAILYHPHVLKCPQVSFMYKKSSLSYLVAIEGSSDNLVTELIPLLDSAVTRKHLGIPSECLDLLKTAGLSASSVPTLILSCSKQIIQSQSSHWNSHLNTLTVQKKFQDVVSLESDEAVWS